MHIQLIGTVEPKSPDGKVWRFPYGLPMVIGQLEDTGHTFDVIDTHLHKLSPEELIDFVRGCDAKAYGISAWTEGYKLTRELAATIRQVHPDAVIIVGGFLARSDEALFAHTEVDVAVTAADGHLILSEILDAIDEGVDFADITGISWRDKDGNAIYNPPRSLMSKEQYYQSEMPAYHHFDAEIRELVANVQDVGYGKVGQKDEPVKAFPLMVSRGCPFDCTFCGMMEGQKFYRKKWEAVFDEMEHLMDTYGIEGFISNDTNFCLNDRDVDAYCAEYDRRGHSFRIITNNRPDFGTTESLRKSIDHGNVVACFGWESGSQDILDVMRKKSRAEDVIAHAKLVAETGMIIYGNFLFGMPGENKKTIRETTHFMRELEKTFAWQRRDFEERNVPYKMSSGYNHSILVALPTSEIFDVAVELGMITDMDDYLCYLDPGEQASEEYSRQHSRYRGSDINLSEFSSKQAMIHYVRYQMASVKSRATLYEPLSAASLQTAGRSALTALAELGRHYFRTAGDHVMRRESAKMKADKAEVKRRMLEGNRRLRVNQELGTKKQTPPTLVTGPAPLQTAS